MRVLIGTSGFSYDDWRGYFYPPEKPGLGIELNEDVIREHPYKQGFFNMWEPDWHMRNFGGGS